MSEPMILRDYQQAAVDAVYDHLRSRDDNPCVVLPTGAGKSLVIGKIAADAVNLWNGRVLVLAHVKELLEQNAEKIRKLCPDLPVGIYSAGLGRRDTNTPVLVAGIQSIYKRACELDPFDLVVIDECHLISKDGDGMYRQLLNDCRVINPHMRVIGLTATPFRLDSGLVCTPDHFVNHICYEAGIREMIRDGYLSPLVSKAGATKADFSGLHTRAGEFISDEVESLMATPDLVAAACDEIVAYTQDRKAVLIFATSVSHGRQVVETLRSRHGIDCGFVSGQTPASEREQLLKRFRGDSPEYLFGEPPLKYICNVNVLTTGFDAPKIDCVALLRPTMSPGLLMQMCLDMETEVLTPSGWRRCHEVTKGDLVGSFDLETEEIVYGPAVDKVHRAMKAGETMYGVSSPHLDLRVTDQHTMVVRGRAKTCIHWQLQTAAETSRRRDTFTIPVAGRGSAHRLDAAITDAELEFIGWFLTDGCIQHSSGSVTIAQSTAKYESEVRNVLTACGFGFREYRQVRTGKEAGYSDGMVFYIPRGQGRGTNYGLRGWANLADWLDKDIPSIFDTLSRRQFSILLGAMNLANGRNPVKRDYVSRVMSIAVGCRQRMADRIQQLAIERGYRCNVSRFVNKPSKWNRTPQPQWMLYIKPQLTASVGGSRQYPNGLVPRRCCIQPIGFESNEWVWCLTTEKGTLVTRRNGKVAILGNCGRGFRLAPSKRDCLVLDFGGNIERHGPIDQIRPPDKNKRGTGAAPAKECDNCHALVASGFANCPHCGHPFPPPERAEHDAQASNVGVLAGQYTDAEYEVIDTLYRVHRKRDAADDAPRTMRVDYMIGLNLWKSEFVCLEHTGFARRKAERWWRERCNEPAPTNADVAVEIADAHGLATCESIVVRSVAGERYDRIIRHVLGPIPEAAAANGDFGYDDDEVPF